MFNLTDYHIHTARCGHATGEMQEYVEVALRRGLREIGFSDHLPLVNEPNPGLAMDEEKLPRYVEDVLQMREQFPEIPIKLGIEAEFATGCEEKIQRLLELHDWDYVIGSVELASRTGAVIHLSAHGDLDYGYGEPIHDGETLKIGRLKLEALHTPGHTLGHMSYLLYDPDGAPWMIFTGDALFAGDVGRTDFYGRDKLDEMTGLLYESLFHKILPLGDEVIVCPAHGAGSVCGVRECVPQGRSRPP